MSKCRIYEKPGDWKGTTRMKQDIQVSYHSGFRDDENKLIVESDICHIHILLYSCDDWTGELKNDQCTMSTLLSVKSLDIIIDALIRARDHHIAQDKIWEDNGKVWLSSGGKKDLGSTEEQNRIYDLPWEDVTEKYGGEE